MNNVYDVRQLLKRFGVFVYVGDQKSDLMLMESELRSLFESQFITTEEYTKAVMIIKNEMKDLEYF